MTKEALSDMKAKVTILGTLRMKNSVTLNQVYKAVKNVFKNSHVFWLEDLTQLYGLFKHLHESDPGGIYVLVSTRFYIFRRVVNVSTP